MKHKFSIFLLCTEMALTCPICSMDAESAQEPVMEISILSEDDMDPDLYQGHWQIFDDYFELYVPEWSLEDLPQENAGEGYFYKIKKVDTPKAILMFRKQDGATLFEFGIGNIDKLYDYAVYKQYEDIERLLINDIDCLRYIDSETDTEVLTFYDWLGNSYSLEFSPVCEEDLLPFIRNIQCSLSMKDTHSDAKIYLTVPEVFTEEAIFLTD